MTGIGFVFEPPRQAITSKLVGFLVSSRSSSSANPSPSLWIRFTSSASSSSECPFLYMVVEIIAYRSLEQRIAIGWRPAHVDIPVPRQPEPQPAVPFLKIAGVFPLFDRDAGHGISHAFMYSRLPPLNRRILQNRTGRSNPPVATVRTSRVDLRRRVPKKLLPARPGGLRGAIMY